jgi:apolipoprotein N-acyltransferase
LKWRDVNLLLTLASAVLLILVFPPFDLTWLAPVALAPLLFACAREASWKRRFLNGWMAGSIFWGTVCYWIQFVLEVHGGMGRWGGWGTFLLFALYKGLHMGAFAALSGLLMPRFWAIPAVAALWTGIERTHGPMAFAWLDLGNAGIGMPVALRLAPFIGVYGLSFVFAMLGCAIALIALRRPRRELAWLVVLPGLFALPPLPAPERASQTMLVVQPNVDTEAEWTTEFLAATERRLALLSRASRVDLIVWPEVPAPFYPANPEFREYIGRIARQSSANFLLGAVMRTESGDAMNSAVMLDPAGALLDHYDKINLVPFGEFVPPAFGWVNRITHEAGDFVPGTRIVTFPVNGHRAGAFICYESAFPDLVREFTKAGAEVLVNLSNDGYFGHSAAREQHLEIARMRAAENARWILRSTNDGITVMIDPAGRVTDAMPPYRELSAKMSYAYSRALTPYARWGDWFAWGCLVIGMALVGWETASRTR